MLDIIRPPRLHRGDTVGICSPSGTIAHKREAFERAKENFASATGLKVIVAPNAFAQHYYSAGTTQQRLDDFDGLVNNPEVKAIIFSVGGDTAIDLLSGLDYEAIKRQPKIITGISDATTILSAITAKTGLITFLGVEWLDFAEYDMVYEAASIKRAWFEGNLGKIAPNPQWRDLRQTHTCYAGWQTIRPGKAKGHLIGGNAQSFIQLVGTEYELKLPDAIMCVETYKLPKKQIHKCLMQLKMRGVFEHTRGLIVGYCLDCDDPAVTGNEQPLAETVLEAVGEYDFPIMQIGEIGHWVENTLQPLGAMMRLDAGQLEFEVLGPVTS